MIILNTAEFTPELIIERAEGGCSGTVWVKHPSSKVPAIANGCPTNLKLFKQQTPEAHLYLKAFDELPDNDSRTTMWVVHREGPERDHILASQQHEKIWTFDTLDKAKTHIVSIVRESLPLWEQTFLEAQSLRSIPQPRLRRPSSRQPA